MFGISVSEICKRWKSTLLLAVLMGIIMFLLILVISTFERQVEKYKPFEEMLEQDGEMLSIWLSRHEVAESLDEYINRMKGIKEYHATSILGGQDGEFEYMLYGYDQMIGSYVPDMAEGVWYTEAEKTEADVEIVISPNKLGIGLGDYIELRYLEGTSFHVCGVLEDNFSYFNPHRWQKYSSVYDWFLDYEASKESAMLCFADVEELEKAGIAWLEGVTFVVYEPEISDGDKASNEELYAHNTTMKGAYFKDIRERTLREIEGKMLELVPIAVGIAVLVVLGIICLVSLDTMAGLKDYAIFYCCGMKWDRILLINAIKSLLSCVLGFMLMMAARSYLISSGKAKDLLIELGKSQMLGIAAVGVLMVVTAVIVPIVLVRRNTPVSVLKESGM